MAAAYDDLIRKHYETEARERGLDSSSTMQDAVVRERETNWLLRVLELASPSQPVSLCDVGCGNGFSLGEIRRRFPTLKLSGVEFTPGLADLAADRFKEDTDVRIMRGDLRHLDLRDEEFDVLYSQRVLINLLDESDQELALREMVRVLKPGGFLIVIEAFEGPLLSLNAARAEFGLAPIAAAFHNRYLADDFFGRHPRLSPAWTDELSSNFLSSHYFVARVLHPALLGGNPLVRNSHFVRFMTAAIPAPIGDYAPIKGYAFHKR